MTDTRDHAQQEAAEARDKELRAAQQMAHALLDMQRQQMEAELNLTANHIEPGKQPGFDLPHPEFYVVGGALKAIEYGRVGGYLVVFTSDKDRDSYGEYFTERTDYGLERYRNQPVLYHHGQNDALVTAIGVMDTIRVDSYGVYAEAQLDVNHEDPTVRDYARTAYAQVNAGKLFWSSGSANHLVRLTENGEITQWWIVEGSLTPKPAEYQGRTQVEVLRAATKALLDDHAAIEATTLKEPDVPKKPNFRRKGTKMSMKMDIASVMSVLDGVGELSPELKWQIATAMAAAEAGDGAGEVEIAAEGEEPVPPPAPAEEPAVAARTDKPVDVNATARSILEAMRGAVAKPLPAGGGNNPTPPRTPANQIVVRSKFEDFSAEDMAFLNDRRRLLAMRNGYQYVPEPAFIREIVVKAQKAYKSGSMKGLDEDTARRVLAIKDNELDNTATSGQASDWVPTLWTSDLWRRVRLENNVASAIRSIEMPAQTYEMPVESTDPTVYKVPETTNEAQLTLASSANPIPDSVLASAKKTLTAVKLGLRVGFSTEMEEDSIIPWIPQLRDQAMWAMMNAIDYTILNGDTTTTASTNINDIAGTPAATDKFLVFNGMRKLGLVTNTDVSTNAQGSAPTLQMIREARFKMQSTLNAYALYPDNLVMFCDPYTYGKILNIDEINVWMNNGREATVNTGQVKALDGVPIFPSSQLLLANTAGKRDDDTLTNNTTGTIIIAARTGWTLGYRRQVTTSVDFLPYYDSYQFVSTVRLALVNRDTVVASVIYNLDV